MENIQNTLSGRTSPAHSAATKERTSERSLKKSSKSKTETFLFLDLKRENGRPQAALWETATALRGECWTPNFGASPKEESVSLLSEVLETKVPQKYYLSARACEGILRRAARRGKDLPPILKTILTYQAENLPPKR